MDSERGEGRRAGGSAVTTWWVVTALSASFVLWGLFLFFAVGDKGPSPWDFGVIDDLPGSSPYATHGPRQFPALGRAPTHGVGNPVPQHVGGKESK